MKNNETVSYRIPAWFDALATVLAFVVVVFLAALGAGVALVLVLGLGHLLSRWFTLSLFQGAIVTLGACLLAVHFTWGGRITHHLEDIKDRLSSLAESRILVSDEDFDDEDEDDEGDEK